MEQRVIPVEPRAYQIAVAVERFCDEHGYSPTVRELGDVVGLRSSSTIQFHIRHAVRAGLLQHDALNSRTIRPVRERCSHGRP